VKLNSSVRLEQRIKMLAGRIAAEFMQAKHCGVYEPDLSQLWPPNGTSREAEVAEFARRYGWRLRYYKEGFCAIFDQDSSL
jgi:hypothetical protein